MNRGLLSVLALALAIGTAPPAVAGKLYGQGIPGSACVPSNSLDEDWYEYVESRLVNTHSDAWHIFEAVCPVGEFQPAARADQIQVLIRDESQREAWCALFNLEGKLVDQQWVRFSGSKGTAVFPPPSNDLAEKGLVSGTLRCLVHPKASINWLAIVWETK